MLSINLKRMIETDTARLNGFEIRFAPDFEAVLYASEYSKYIKGYFMLSDVQKASSKFQEMLKKYQSYAFNVHTLGDGPTLKMHFSYKKLLKQAKKENIKYFTSGERKQFLDNFRENEELRLNEWFEKHPQIKLEAEKKYKEFNNPKSESTAEKSEIDNIYNDIMKNAEINNEK